MYICACIYGYIHTEPIRKYTARSNPGLFFMCVQAARYKEHNATRDKCVAVCCSINSSAFCSLYLAIKSTMHCCLLAFTSPFNNYENGNRSNGLDESLAVNSKIRILVTRRTCNRLHKTATDALVIDCNSLQQTATDCNSLQQTTTNCNRLQQSPVYCSCLQNVCMSIALCCTLQQPAAA